LEPRYATRLGRDESTSNGDGPYSHEYDYDKQGNMTLRFGWGGEVQGGHANGGDTTLTYGYSNGKNQRDGLGYDAAGNLKDGESNQHYLYDATGQQTNAWQVNGYAMAQGYDGDGLRARKDDTSTTFYLRSSVLGGAVVAEMNGSGNFSRGYAYAGDQLLTVQQSGHMYWVHEDAITKSQRTTDVYGNVTSDGVVELDPWGANTARSSATVFQPQNFTSYTRDLNGDQDAMARRYSVSGRFSQPDPFSGSYDFSDPQSLNRYAYVGNDPVNRKDPSGLAAMCTTPDGMSGWVGDDGKCHATVSSDTPARILINPMSHSSVVGSISMSGLLSGTRDHGGDPALARGGSHVTGKENRLDQRACSELRELLRREAKYGTDLASAMSAVDFGTKPLKGLANERIGTITINGKALDLDWWMATARLNLTPAVSGGPAIGYAVGKSIWVVVNEAFGTPRQNRIPFISEAAERYAVELATLDAPFKSVFTPEFMNRECPP
jgi:RHS repeat-associated protein